MPMKCKHPCSFPSCGILTSERFCELHQRSTEKAYERERGTAVERGYNATWRKVRVMKLNNDPLCEICEAVAVLVHHLDRDPHNNLEANLKSLCVRCHDAVHRRDKWKR